MSAEIEKNEMKEELEHNEMRQLVKGVEYWKGIRDEYQAKVMVAERELKLHYALISDLHNKARATYYEEPTESPIDYQPFPEKNIFQRIRDIVVDRFINPGL